MTLHDSLYYATPEDIAFFNEATDGLPKRLPDEPYHCGPQNVAAFRYAVSIATVVNSRVLEIGFNLGHSAACWLALGCCVHSVEIRDNDRIESAVRVLAGGRFFQWKRADFEKAAPLPCDLAFVDGDHTYEGVKADIALCKEHSIQRFLFDDWYPHHGPGVQQAVFDAGLLPLAVIGSMAYCEEPTLRGFVKQPEIV